MKDFIKGKLLIDISLKVSSQEILCVQDKKTERNLKLIQAFTPRVVGSNQNLLETVPKG